jgi:ABC-type transporter Mla subunit MlaD
MPDHGADLGVDLYKLLVVAKDDLPSVATIYADADTKFRTIANSVTDVMRRPDHFGDTLGPVYTSWVSLHDTVASVLSKTESSLSDTAKVLADAANRYAETDRAAAKRFNDLRRQDGEPRVNG